MNFKEMNGPFLLTFTGEGSGPGVVLTTPDEVVKHLSSDEGYGDDFPESELWDVLNDEDQWHLSEEGRPFEWELAVGDISHVRLTRIANVHPQFNQLTVAQIERLAILAEECSEVIQIVNKILRHGYESYHPDDCSKSNRDLLNKELGHVQSAMTLLSYHNDIDQHTIRVCSKQKLKQYSECRYTHHQERVIADTQTVLDKTKDKL